MKVLWLDDDRWILGPYREALELHGHEVTAVESIEEFDAKLRAEAGWQLVLLDVVMPTGGFSLPDTNYGVDTGLAVAKRLRAERPDIKIVLFTIRRDPQVESIARDLDAVVLSKTAFTPWELAERLESVTGGN